MACCELVACGCSACCSRLRAGCGPPCFPLLASCSSLLFRRLLACSLLVSLCDRFLRACDEFAGLRAFARLLACCSRLQAFLALASSLVALARFLLLSRELACSLVASKVASLLLLSLLVGPAGKSQASRRAEARRRRFSGTGLRQPKKKKSGYSSQSRESRVGLPEELLQELLLKSC